MSLFATLLAATLIGVGPQLELTGTLVVLNKAEASASLLDLGTGAEVTRVPTEPGPHEVAVSPDGRTAVVANYGLEEPGDSLTVIDLLARRVVKTIRLGEHHRPHGLQFLRDGKRVAVTAEQEQHVLLVDVETGRVERAVHTAQDVTHMVVLVPDSDLAFASAIGSGTVSVLDLVAGEVRATLRTGRGAEGLDIAPHGGEVWVGNRDDHSLSVIDVSSLSVVATIPCRAVPIRVKFTPDGRHVLVSNARSGDVAVFDAVERREVRRVRMPSEGSVPVGILIEPGGRYAFVANTNADVVAVLDLKTWAIVGHLTAGDEPDGLGYSSIRPPSSTPSRAAPARSSR